MLRNPFSFTGRIRRTEYGVSMIIYMIAALAISFLAQIGGTAFYFLLIAYIPLIWFVLAQSAKRCHDRDNSGWYQLIPFYGFWMLFAEGNSGENQYGPDPKGLANLEQFTI